LQITIPSPCHEKWQDMTPVEKGRFCASCQRVVHDFTRSSDREIASVLTKESNACGRFQNNQLNRELIIPKEKKPVWIAAGAAVVSFLCLGANDAIAQTPVQTEQHQEDQIALGKVALPTVTSRVVTGTVVDETGIPLPGANVIIRGTQTGVQTDFDGNFSIEVKQGDVLEFSFLGYKTETITISESIMFKITMLVDEDVTFTAGIVVTGERTTFFGRIFRTIGNWFREEDVDVRLK
jgi:hypothetical protein